MRKLWNFKSFFNTFCSVWKTSIAKRLQTFNFQTPTFWHKKARQNSRNLHSKQAVFPPKTSFMSLMVISKRNRHCHCFDTLSVFSTRPLTSLELHIKHPLTSAHLFKLGKGLVQGLISDSIKKYLIVICYIFHLNVSLSMNEKWKDLHRHLKWKLPFDESSNNVKTCNLPNNYGSIEALLSLSLCPTRPFFFSFLSSMIWCNFSSFFFKKL